VRATLLVPGLLLALMTGGHGAGAPGDGRLAIELVRADFGAPLHYWGAHGQWAAHGGEVRLAMPDGRLARWRIAFPLDRPLTPGQLRVLSGELGVVPVDATARRLSRLPVLAPPRPNEAVALSARLLSLARGRAHVGWVPVYAADADFAWRGGRNAAFLRGLALGRRSAPLSRSWVRLAPGARVSIPSGRTPVVLLRWRAAGATSLRGVVRRPVDAISAR
jgi:hypothetical protein